MNNHFCVIQESLWYGPWVWRKINIIIKTLFVLKLLTIFAVKVAETVEAIAHELTGDKHGVITVRNQQILYVHYVESTHTFLDAPCR